MIHHLNKTHCNPHEFHVGEKQACAGDIDMFLPTLYQQHTSLADFLRHKVPDSWLPSRDYNSKPWQTGKEREREKKSIKLKQETLE